MVLPAAVLLLALCQGSGTTQPSPAASAVTEASSSPADASAADDPMFVIGVEYLYWWLHRMRVPPLATTGAPGSQAILGEPGTDLLYGGDRLESRHDRYVGIRLNGDVWLDDAQTIGLHGSAFFLERDSSNFTIGYHKVTPLARPFLDAATGAWQSQVVAGTAPGIGDLSGGFNAYSRVELFGEDLNVLFSPAGDGFRIGGLVGGRFLQMRERLDLTATSRLLPAETTLFGTEDHIHTFNKFYGVQGGGLADYHWGPVWVRGQATLALGADDQRIETSGTRIFQTPFVRQQVDYGLLILPSNRGNFERAFFDVVCEVKLTVGWDVTSWLALRGGYSFLYWMQPVRPGDQIQPINLTQVAPGGLVGAALPAGVPFHTDCMWAQGLSAGAEVCW